MALVKNRSHRANEMFIAPSKANDKREAHNRTNRRDECTVNHRFRKRRDCRRSRTARNTHDNTGSKKYCSRFILFDDCGECQDNADNAETDHQTHNNTSLQ